MISQTDSADDKWLLNWKIMPDFTPNVIVDPPMENLQLSAATTADISDTLHNALLEGGIRDYADIWRDLAQR